MTINPPLTIALSAIAPSLEVCNHTSLDIAAPSTVSYTTKLTDLYHRDQDEEAQLLVIIIIKRTNDGEATSFTSSGYGST